jgi:hypothetical protein
MWVPTSERPTWQIICSFAAGCCAETIMSNASVAIMLASYPVPPSGPIKALLLWTVAARHARIEGAAILNAVELGVGVSLNELPFGPLQADALWTHVGPHLGLFGPADDWITLGIKWRLGCRCRSLCGNKAEENQTHDHSPKRRGKLLHDLNISNMNVHKY